MLLILEEFNLMLLDLKEKTTNDFSGFLVTDRRRKLSLTCGCPHRLRAIIRKYSGLNYRTEGARRRIFMT